MVKTEAEILEQGMTLAKAGVEFGNSLLESAVNKADTVEQAENQLFVLRVAAVHLLATCAFNHEKNYNVSADMWLSSVVTELRQTLEATRSAFKAGEMDIIASKSDGQAH